MIVDRFLDCLSSNRGCYFIGAFFFEYFVILR